MDEQRLHQFTDALRGRIESLLPSSDGRRDRPFRNNRRAVEGIILLLPGRYRRVRAARLLRPVADSVETSPALRHRRHLGAVLARILADADAAGDIDWTVSVDATINRAHQHATNTTRPEQHTGGAGELHETRLPPD